MRLRSFTAALLLTSSLNPAQAQVSPNVFIATGQFTIPPLVACKQGVFADDGCQSAPAPLTASFGRSNTFAPGGYINTFSATPTNYMATNCGPSANQLCRPPFNVAGNADDGFRIGYISTAAQMASTAYDPANISVAGCSYAPTGGGGGSPLLTCSTPTFLGELQHVELGPTGGHGCTALFIKNTTSTAERLHLNDIHFRNDSGRCSVGGSGGYAIHVSGNTWTSDSLVENIEMDGGSDQWADYFGPSDCVAGNAKCNPVSAIDGGFGYLLTIQYSAIYNFGYYVHSSGAWTDKFDWFECGTARAPNGHAECILGPALGGASIPGETFDHMTMIGWKFSSQFGPVGTGVYYAANWGSTIGVNGFVMNDMTFVSPYAGGLATPTATFSGCFGMPPATGGTATNPICQSGTGAVPIVYQTSTTPNVIGQGIILNSCTNVTGGGTSAGGVLWQFIPGPYTNVGGAPPIQGEWYLDNFAGAEAAFAAGTLAGGKGTFTIPAATCTNVTISAASSPGNQAIFSGHGPTPVQGPVSITNNRIDVSSANGGQVGSMSGGQVFAFMAISGTTMLTHSAITLATGELLYNSTLADCATTALSCPAIATGGTTGASGLTAGGTAVNFSGGINSYINEASFTGTITGGNTLVTSAPTSLVVNDFVYETASGICTSLNPNSCPQITAVNSSTNYTISTSPANASARTMTTLRSAHNFSGSINNANPAALGTGHIVLQAINGGTIQPGPDPTNGPFIGVAAAPCSAGGGLTNTTHTVNTDCPQVTSAGITTFTVTNPHSVTVGGTNSMVSTPIIQAAWCNSPAVFSGNIDMANIRNDLNAWTGTQPFQGGC